MFTYMKHLLAASLIVLSHLAAFGQSFEGTLTYKVEFEIKPQKMGGFEITEEQIIEKMKREGEYFDTVTVSIKGGNYTKQDNSGNEKKLVYHSDQNKVFTLQKDFEYVVVTDAARYSNLNVEISEPDIMKLDSVKNIRGVDCRILKLSWDNMGDEYYFYNSETAGIDPKLFSDHNLEYLNQVLEITQAYPLEIVKTVTNFITVTMTMVSISEEAVDESIFDIPELIPAEKDYAEMMQQMTGSDVMKIKN